MELTSYLLGKKNGGTQPTGTIDITTNGTTNVSGYATADVNVQPNLESKSIEITENTTTTITPTQGKDGLSSVQVTTNVSVTTPITKFSELTTAMTNDLRTLGNYAKNTILPNYTASTSEATTLYYPTQYYTNYAVCRYNSKYFIIWGAFDLYYKNSAYINNGYIVFRKRGTNPLNPSGQSINSNNITDNAVNIEYTMQSQSAYKSPEYNSLNEALEAIKSSSTTYAIPYSSSIYYTEVLYTNALYCDATDLVTNMSKVSSNETLTLIS